MEWLPECPGLVQTAQHMCLPNGQISYGLVLLNFGLLWLQDIGINMDDMVLSQPDYGEMAFSVIDELARSGAVDLVVVDSVSALVPRSEIEGDFGVQQVRRGEGTAHTKWGRPQWCEEMIISARGLHTPLARYEAGLSEPSYLWKCVGTCCKTDLRRMKMLFVC